MGQLQSAEYAVGLTAGSDGEGNALDVKAALRASKRFCGSRRGRTGDDGMELEIGIEVSRELGVGVGGAAGSWRVGHKSRRVRQSSE